jgi:cytidylate kinase
MTSKFTVAIDGPAAAGKGTISKAVAQAFGFAHLDTGLLYRAVGSKILMLGDHALTTEMAVTVARILTPEDLLDGNLRSSEVAQAASRVAVIPEVREILLDFQREFSRRDGGAVLDGRDIGTVICPDANVKLFITASAEIRAERRFLELDGKGHNVSRSGVLMDVIARDKRDSERVTAPLIAAVDAVVIDTSEMSIKHAVDVAKSVVENVFSGL